MPGTDRGRGARNVIKNRGDTWSEGVSQNNEDGNEDPRRMYDGDVSKRDWWVDLVSPGVSIH